MKRFMKTAFSLQQNSECSFIFIPFFFFLKVLCFLEQNRHCDQGDVLFIYFFLKNKKNLPNAVYLAGSEMAGPRSSLMVQGSEVAA